MTIDELKDFILWCKSTKLKKFKNSDIEFELSDMAFIDELNLPSVKEMVLGGGSDMLETAKPQSPEEVDDDLFWSAR